jgi:UDP-N-acetylmuramyl pentapeptide phosphotransferase/UDP-N-acetylglucosamine-1-phosphate transferase
MGDVGSTTLGYTFAVLPLAAPTLGAPGTSPWIGVGAVFPFVYDAASTFVRRALGRENVFAAHRTHTYQLLALRIGHGPVAAAWALLAALSGGVSVAFAFGHVAEWGVWGALVAVAWVIEVARRAAAPVARSGPPT